MSISRIVDPDFTDCRDCIYRKKRKDMRRNRPTTYYCELHARRLFGQRGCSVGIRRR